MSSQSSSWTPNITLTPFRQVEKHFKNRAIKGRLPSLRKYPVVDLSRPEKAEDDPLWTAGWWSPENDVEVDPSGRRRAKGKARALGERPGEMMLEGVREIRLLSGKKGYVVADGCILIPGYLNQQQQLDLLEASLSKYTRPPNPLSLSTHYNLPPGLFERYESGSSALIYPIFDGLTSSEQDEVRAAAASRDGQQALEGQAGQDLGVEEILNRQKAWKGDLPAEGLVPKTAEGLMGDLRWTNLGLVYKWTTKMYDLDPAAAIPFPSELAAQCREIIREADWREVYGDAEMDRIGAESWAEDYVPDTGIVNFYQMKDTMMGHVDRAELDPYRPLISISLGHAAVFLLGSNSRDVAPIPIILRSGDVILMSGSGRQRYHGVPRVLEGTLPSHFDPDETDNSSMKAAKRWIATGRINVNARQVYPPGLKRDGEMRPGS